MIVKIQRRDSGGFAIVNRAILEDTRLSWKAKGMMAYLLSRPEVWQVISNDLINRSLDGREAVLAGMNELKALGYAKLENDRDELGRVSGRHWIVFERPEPIDGLSVERENRQSDKPTIGKPASSNKEEGSKKKEPSKKEDTSPEMLAEIQTLTARIKERGHSELWEGFLASRRKKKGKETSLAVVLILRTLFQHPNHIKKGLTMAITREWIGFDWDWVDDKISKEPVRSSEPPRPKPPELPIVIEPMSRIAHIINGTPAPGSDEEYETFPE